MRAGQLAQLLAGSARHDPAQVGLQLLHALALPAPQNVRDLPEHPACPRFRHPADGQPAEPVGRRGRALCQRHYTTLRDAGQAATTR